MLATIREYTFKLAKALNVVGLMNIQYAIQREKVYVIEVNPRASRTVPYVSKATGVACAKIAARLMTGRKLKEFLPENIAARKDLDTGEYFYVKSPVFPWNKFPGVDTVLGPEMRSTGEVMGVADNFGEAFAKAQLAAGQALPSKGTVFISVNEHDKPYAAEVARKFVDMGFKIVATHGTAEALEEAGMRVERVYKVKEGRPNVVDLIKGDRIQLIINTPQARGEPWFDEKAIRRAAITARIPTITTLSAARAVVEGIPVLQAGVISVCNLQELHAAHDAVKQRRGREGIAAAMRKAIDGDDAAADGDVAGGTGGAAASFVRGWRRGDAAQWVGVLGSAGGHRQGSGQGQQGDGELRGMAAGRRHQV